MKKLPILMTAAVLAIAISEPSFAAPRANRTDTVQATGQLDQVRRDYYDAYGLGYDTYARGNGAGIWSGNRIINSDEDGRGNGAYGYVPSQNLPYPDRPYGAPNKD